MRKGVKIYLEDEDNILFMHEDKYFLFNRTDLKPMLDLNKMDNSIVFICKEPIIAQENEKLKEEKPTKREKRTKREKLVKDEKPCERENHNRPFFHEGISKKCKKVYTFLHFKRIQSLSK